MDDGETVDSARNFKVYKTLAEAKAGAIKVAKMQLKKALESLGE